MFICIVQDVTTKLSCRICPLGLGFKSLLCTPCNSSLQSLLDASSSARPAEAAFQRAAVLCFNGSVQKDMDTLFRRSGAYEHGHEHVVLACPRLAGSRSASPEGQLRPELSQALEQLEGVATCPDVGALQV